MAGAGTDDDAVLRALDDLTTALQENVSRSEAVMARADEIRRLRAQGLSYRDIVPEEDRPLIVQMIGDNLERLFEAGSRFRRAEARALHDEGLTMDRIAELFGVTRQRVSALLKASRRDDRK